MDPNPDQRAAFGARLRELRKERGLRAEEVASRLPARDDGSPVQHQSVTGWERGEYAPSKVSIVQALEEILDAPGALLPLLGYQADELEERLSRIEQTIAEQGEALRALRDLLPDGR